MGRLHAVTVTVTPVPHGGSPSLRVCLATGTATVTVHCGIRVPTVRPQAGRGCASDPEAPTPVTRPVTTATGDVSARPPHDLRALRGSACQLHRTAAATARPGGWPTGASQAGGKAASSFPRVVRRGDALPPAGRRDGGGARRKRRAAPPAEARGADFDASGGGARRRFEVGGVRVPNIENIFLHSLKSSIGVLVCMHSIIMIH
jgi:hypothetical protein